MSHPTRPSAGRLRLNGASLGRKTSDDHRFVWKGIDLAIGPNRVYVEGQLGDWKVTDSCAWTRTTGEIYRPTPEPPAPSDKK